MHWTRTEPFYALADHGPCSSFEFSDAAKIDERYGREWLYTMYAAGYCLHDEFFQKFSLSDEQKAVFAYEDSPALMLRAYDVFSGKVHGIEKVMMASKTGAGVDHGAFLPCVSQGKGLRGLLNPHMKPTLSRSVFQKFQQWKKILRKGGDNVILSVVGAFLHFCLHPNIKRQSLWVMIFKIRLLPRRIAKQNVVI